MLSYICDKMDKNQYKIIDKLKMLLVGGKRRKLFIPEWVGEELGLGEISNERQIIFITVTGISYTYFLAKAGSGAANIAARVVAGLAGTFIPGYFFIFAMSNSWQDKNFSIVQNDKFNPFFKPRHVYILYTSTDKLKFLVMHIPSILITFSILSHVTKGGFEYIANSFLSSKIAKAAAFVMVNLVAIYPTSVCQNLENEIGDVSTISGLMGFISFCAIAGVLQNTRLGSFKYSMLFLKTVPIFLACVEAISQELYGAENDDEVQLSTKGTIMKCIAGSSILTCGFIGGDLLTTKLCSTVLFSKPGIAFSTVKFITEFALAPIMIISASYLCTSICNSIARATKKPIITFESDDDEPELQSSGDEQSL